MLFKTSHPKRETTECLTSLVIQKQQDCSLVFVLENRE